MDKKYSQKWKDAGIKRHLRQVRFEYMCDQINAMRNLSDTQIRLANIDGDTQFIQSFTQEPQGSKLDPLYRTLLEKQHSSSDSGTRNYISDLLQKLTTRSMCERMYKTLCEHYVPHI